MKHENRFESIPSGSEDNVPALLRKKHFPSFFFLKLHTLIGIILAGFCIPYSLIPYKAIRSVNALKGTLQYVIWHFAHYLGTYNKSAFCQGLQSRLPRDLLSTSAQFVK